MTVERDAVSQSMSLLLENMSEQAQARLAQWLPEIEEQAVQSITQLTNQQVSRRRPEIIAVAALYRAFLEFESRTGVRVRTPFLSEALGVALCSISSVYHALFNKKVKVLNHRIELIRMLSNDPADLVIEVIDSLQNALEEQTSRTKEYFTCVQADAISMVSSLEKKQYATYDPDVLAAAAVFGAIQQQPTREVVHVSQIGIAMTNRFSPAMLSKVWLELLYEGRLSVSVRTEVK
jgi:hypothetical protein